MSDVTADQFADDEDVTISGAVLKELVARAGGDSVYADAAWSLAASAAWMAALSDHHLSRVSAEFEYLREAAYFETTKRNSRQ